LPLGTITPEEVERAQRAFLKNREQLMTDPGSVAVELSEWGAKGDWRLFFLHRDRIAAVKPADVARVARQYLVKSNRTVGMFVPTDDPLRAEIAATPPIADMVKDYKGKAVVASGEAFDPSPANIDQRTRRGQLPCGIKTALLPKKTRGEAVNAQ